jgi:branched-chain amino acid aminotransferase/4-amino-4-deoxychorismate lyase
MTIPLDDRGFTLGDGLFETVLAQDGRLALWREHVDRLSRGCATLGLPTPREDTLRRHALAALDEAGLRTGRAAVRLSWSAGGGGRGLDRPGQPAPRLVVQAAPAPLPAGPARLVTVSVRRNQRSPISRLKTLSYLDQVLARREAAAAGGDEALMLNGAGMLACAAAANIFWLAKGVLHTPSLECGVLDGLVRARLIASAPMEVRQSHSGREALDDAEAIFLTNCLIGVRAVAWLDGRAIDGQQLALQIAEAVL